MRRVYPVVLLALACLLLAGTASQAGEIKYSASLGELLRLSNSRCVFRLYSHPTRPEGHYDEVTAYTASRPRRYRNKGALSVSSYSMPGRRCDDTPLTHQGRVLVAQPGFCGQMMFISLKLTARQKRDYDLGEWFYMLTLWPGLNKPGPWFTLYFDLLTRQASSPDVDSWEVTGFWNTPNVITGSGSPRPNRFFRGRCWRDQ